MEGESPPRILITGASDGIGRACAQTLSARGAEVILCDDQVEPLAAVAEQLAATARYCDVSSEASVAVFAADLLGLCPGLDVVINAAGGGYQRTLGMYRVSRALLPALKRGGRQRLLVNVPPSEEDGEAAIFPYASSLQAFHRLSAALAAETRGTGVQVVIACPRTLKITQAAPDRDACYWPEDGVGGLAERDGEQLIADDLAALIVPPSPEDERRIA
ncbi:SDR family NAD(P)-dependent oxidoreductase [Sphingomonas xanthus]|uniref:SDR family oxidoreductase n=1 Tax=Sphingomonas xanthus TaxID=2594473 RepID=A0A516IQ15_9SPHN|nr:SDR family NAD(P)-dependent oxidoreductase [Sphingomonas xanthus]QDP18956.1 SDR family oxidoreductase [Sphingomonas xanthus]